MKNLLSLVTASILLSVTAFASDLKCSKNGTNLIYINGASTLKKKAEFSLSHLKNLAENSYIDSESDVKYILSYNSTSGKFKDYLESYSQKAREFGLSSTDAYVLLFRVVVGLPKIGLYIGATTFVVENLWNLVDPSYVTFSESMKQQNQDTNELRNKIVTSLFDEKKTVVVSHSQGGLFSNDAYDKLIELNPYVGHDKNFRDVEKFVGNLQIATPASFSHFLKQRHITNDKDLILKIPGSWRADLYPFDVGEGFDPRTIDEKKQNHGIIDTYLADYDELSEDDPFDGLREELFEKLYQVAEDLESNCNTCGAKENRCGGIGEFYINPNGTCGGFIADTAIVSKGMYISPNVDICGYSKIVAGSDTRIESSVIHNSNIIVPSFFPVDIIGSTLMGATIGQSAGAFFGGVYIERSTINNSLFSSWTQINISESTINGKIEGGGILVLDSTVSSDIKGGTSMEDLIVIENSVINAPLTALRSISVEGATINEPKTGTNINCRLISGILYC